MSGKRAFVSSAAREPSRYIENPPSGTRWYLKAFLRNLQQNSPIPFDAAFLPESRHKKTLLRLLSRGLIFGTPIIRHRRLWRIKRDLTTQSDVRDPSSLHYAVTRQSAGQPRRVQLFKKKTVTDLSNKSVKARLRCNKKKEQ